MRPLRERRHPQTRPGCRTFTDTPAIHPRKPFQLSHIATIICGSVAGLPLPTFQIFEMKIPPTLDERNAIAAVLTDMDAELASLEQRLAKTRALKQGMMQELLTGRTRLV